ncbi:MAG: nucleotidyltransferase family protein [Planctomycetes bacterium]|nr:nucleotidyltransferase family protein [Planctomycetota bacterium]
MIDRVVQLFCAGPALRSLAPGRLARILLGQGLPGLALAVLRQRGDLGCMPAPAARALALAADEAGRRGRSAVQAACAVIDLLEARGIEALPLKGADLLLRKSLDPGFRAMGDVDLLVPPGARNVAVEHLLSAGFSPMVKDKAPDYSTHHHAVPLAHPDFAVPVEVHGALEPGGAPDPSRIQELFHRAPRGVSPCLLAPADAKAQIAAHAAVHGFHFPLRVSFDLALLADVGVDDDAFMSYVVVDARRALALARALLADLLLGTSRSALEEPSDRACLRRARFLALHPEGTRFRPAWRIERKLAARLRQRP